MKLTIYLLYLSIWILQVFSTDFGNSPNPFGTSNDLAAAEKLSFDMNNNVFNSRHEQFSTDSLSNKAKKTWATEANKDTVSVYINRHDELHVAANTKTRTKFVPKAQSFQTENFELGPKDHLAILKTVRENPDFRDKTVHIIQLENKPTNAIDNAKPHAEMKNAAYRETTLEASTSKQSKRTSIIVASKPACGKCHGQLESLSLEHNHAGGLPTEKVKNWDHPSEIGGLTKQATHHLPASKRNSYAHPNPLPEGSLSSDIPPNTQQPADTNFFNVPGACSKKRAPGGRRKRATGSGCSGGCAICLGNNNQVESVNQKEFIAKYNEADEHGKQAMANLVKKDAAKVDLSGNQNKVKKLVQLENVKSHSKAIGVVDKIQKISKKIGKVGKNLGKKGWGYLQSVGESLTKFPSNPKLLQIWHG